MKDTLSMNTDSVVFFVYCLFVCLFVCLFSHSRMNFSLIWRRHQYRWRAANVVLCSAFNGICIDQFLKRATPTVTRDIRLEWPSPMTSGIPIYCRAFNSGAVITYFYDLGLLRLGRHHCIRRNLKCVLHI